MVGTQAFGHFQAESGQDAFGLALGAGDPSKYQLAAVGCFQVNVAELNPGQFAQDDLRRHGSRLGDGGAVVFVWFMDQSHQAGTLGQVVQRFPQRVGQHTDEDMSLATTGIVMPNRPQ